MQRRRSPGADSALAVPSHSDRGVRGLTPSGSAARCAKGLQSTQHTESPLCSKYTGENRTPNPAVPLDDGEMILTRQISAEIDACLAKDTSSQRRRSTWLSLPTVEEGEEEFVIVGDDGRDVFVDEGTFYSRTLYQTQ